MSTTLSEFLAAWNETMTIQIRDADIKNPTEPILRRWLIAILKEFYVDTQCFENMDNESGNRLRMLRIALVGVVDRFFKIASPLTKTKQQFLFIELIQPTYKRVFNVLNYLLNYAVFVRHVHKTTILDLKDKLHERDQLRTTKNQLRAEIESAKIQEENNNKSIKEFEVKIPKLRRKLNELEEKLQKSKGELANIQAQCDKNDLDLIEKKSNLTSIRNRGISDQEIESIVSAMKTIKFQLEEQDQINEAGRQKLTDHSNLIEEAHAMTARMEMIQSSCIIDAGQIESKKTAIENLSKEFNGMEINVSKLESEMELLSQNLAMKNKFVYELLKQRDELKMVYGLKREKLSKESKEIGNILRQLIIQEQALSNEQQRLLREFELLHRVASSAIKHISKKIFENQD